MHFAEFLNANSSVRLRILSSPTCVGLWYGPSWTGLRKCFSARRLHALRLPVGRLPPGSPQDARLTASLVGSPLRPGLPSPGCASPYASFHRIHERHGNLDPFPIGYDLRPRLRGRLTPGQIAFTLETLGFRRTGIPPVFSLLMPAFSLPSPPAGLPPHLHRYMECSLLSQPPGCLCSRTSFPTWHTFGTLTVGLGCFPLDDGPYQSPSDCCILYPGIRSLVKLGTR